MIKKIIVEIDGEEIELTKEKALEIKKDLDEIFAEPVSVPINIPYPIFPEPNMPYYRLDKYWDVGEVTCFLGGAN